MTMYRAVFFSWPPVNRGRDPSDFLLDLQDVWPILPLKELNFSQLLEIS